MKAMIFTPFNADLVHHGLKTRTRRIVKNAPEEASMVKDCPYGKIGDDVVIKEAYSQMGYWTRDYRTKKHNSGLSWDFNPMGGVVLYGDDPNARTKIDLEYPSKEHLYQRKAMFMPWDLARTIVKITDIIVCNMNDMSDEDCFDEGITEMYGGLYGMGNWPKERCKRTPIEAYADLWEEINGEGAWANNDLVYDIAFEKTAAI
jgi:hypothetical protein